MQKYIGMLALTGAASIWGGMYVVSKYVLDFVPPFTLLWLRYVVGFIVLVGTMIYRKTPPAAKEKLPSLLWLGFIGYFVSVGAQFLGTWLSSAHMGSLLTSAAPAFIVILAWPILGERIDLGKIISLVIATLGVIVVVGFEGDKGNSLGNAFLIFAALTWALLSVYAKKSAQELPVLTITTYAIFFAILFTTPVMIWESLSKGFNFKIILNPVLSSGVLYLGIVSTAIAFFLWNKGMELMEAGIGALFFFFQPVVGSFLGWLILKESLTWNFFLGGLLILLGVAMVSLRERRDSRRENNCIKKPQLVHSSTEATTEGGKVIAGKNA